MTSGAKSNLIAAIVIGGAVAFLTAIIGHAYLPFFLVFFAIPGMLGSMIVVGNIHAFPLWIAACFNFVFYFLLIMSVGAIIRALYRRRHSRPGASSSDNLD